MLKAPRRPSGVTRPVGLLYNKGVVGDVGRASLLGIDAFEPRRCRSVNEALFSDWAVALGVVEWDRWSSRIWI